jgi:glycosyltransferase involved in cell wall biosynthesis
MKKVCIITNVPSPYRVDFFNYLIDSYKQYSFKILYSTSGEDNRGWNTKKINIRNSEFLKSKSLVKDEKMDKKYIHFSVNIISVLNKFNPDIVIGCEYNPIVTLAYIWSKIKNKKYISWSDGTLNSESNINFIQKILRKIICSNSNALIASSTKTKEAQLYYGSNESKIFISYLTVDVNKYKYKKVNFKSDRLLFVGRLSYTKGLDLLFSALSKVKSKYLLTIVGDGPEKDELIKISKSLGIKDKINFLGSKNGNELIKIYMENDIFILPSRRDCFGLVLTEAMCNSMLVMSSKLADGSYDLIEEGENGFIFDPYNETELTNLIEKIIRNNELVKKMGENSFKLVERFDFNMVSRPFIDAIEYVNLN